MLLCSAGARYLDDCSMGQCHTSRRDVQCDCARDGSLVSFDRRSSVDAARNNWKFTAGLWRFLLLQAPAEDYVVSPSVGVIYPLPTTATDANSQRLRRGHWSTLDLIPGRSLNKRTPRSTLNSPVVWRGRYQQKWSVF